MEVVPDQYIVSLGVFVGGIVYLGVYGVMEDIKVEGLFMCLYCFFVLFVFGSTEEYYEFIALEEMCPCFAFGIDDFYVDNNHFMKNRLCGLKTD